MKSCQMKSYLSLIPISARVRRLQNRMTIFCILTAVFLVTTIFSMADMGVRMEKSRVLSNHGNWHIALQSVSKSDAEQIGQHAGVAAAAWYDVVNYDMDKDYFIGGKRAVLCGADEQFATDIMNNVSAGSFPQSGGEVMLTVNAQTVLGVEIGENIVLDTPYGSRGYIISGFCVDTGYLLQYDAVGVFFTMEEFERLCALDESGDLASSYYVQFNSRVNAKRLIAQIKEEYGLSDESVTENTALLGVEGLSSDSYVTGLYLIAAVLFFLVLTAGVFMLAGSINSNVAERSQFFGMLRCLGASRQQIVRFVRLEALNRCKTAVPAGVALGVVMTWGICLALRFAVAGEFVEIPLFEVSAAGMVSGALVGLLTVVLAAQSPASRAAGVSPIAAAVGSVVQADRERRAVKPRFVKIETALGVHHASAARKNLVLMTGSFAFSIILLLSFLVLLEWGQRALPSLHPYAPDLSIASADSSNTVERTLLDEISGMTGVKRVFGRMYAGGVSVTSDKGVSRIDLISYEAYQLKWAKELLAEGDLSKLCEGGDYVLMVYEQSNPLAVGDRLTLGGTQLEVAAVLTTSPFDSTDIPTVICTEELFTRLTGETDYAVIDIQLEKSAGDADADMIRALAGDRHLFSDRRVSNRESTAVYWAFSVLVYGFLAIIALISVFNIINSISMSVSARIRQYGMMRAVGMDGGQLTKMTAAEAFTYALSGSAAGCALGLPLNCFLFHKMITAYWGEPWSVPVLQLVVVLLLVAVSCAAAVYAPAKRIRNMAVTETINAL